MTITETAPQATDQAEPPRSARRLPYRLVLGVGGLAAAWIVPVLTNLAHLDVILPVLLVLAVMSLLRSGRTIIDRFVLALALLFGITCLAGMALSVWPWGLSPVPTAGTAFSAAVLIAVAAGRRPNLRLGRLTRTDLMMLATTVVSALLVAKPFVRRDLGGRLGLIASGEDFARHLNLFDTIGLINGYAFMHRTEAMRYMHTGWGLDTYPQGTHFLIAILDRFARSSTVNGSGIHAMDWLLWCHLGIFVFFVFAVLWAVRRVAGPAPHLSGATVVFVGAATFMLAGDPVTIFLRGFPNEVLGLALVAILIAVLARPLHSVREQLVVVMLLFVGISFAYYMFLPVAFGAMALTLITMRKRLRRHLVATVLAAIATAAGGAVPILANPAGDKPSKLLLGGVALKVDRPLTLVLVLIVAIGIVTGTALRSPAWRLVALSVLGSIGFLAIIRIYQMVKIGTTIYYYEKAYHLLIVVALVGVGAIVRLLPRPDLAAVRSWRQRLTLVAPLVGIALLPAALFGAMIGSDNAGGVRNLGVGLISGKDAGYPIGSHDAIENLRDGDGYINVDLRHGGWDNFYGTLYTAVMQRNYHNAVDWYVFQAPWREPKTIDDMADLVRASNMPVRFLVQSRTTRFLVTNPSHPLSQGGVYGDPSAMTNVAAAEYLARKFPGRVVVADMSS